MKFHPTDLPGVVLVEPDIHGDERGFLLETYNAGAYADIGIPNDFVQDNLSFSRHGILRGLHLQNPHGQGKLVYVLTGEVFDVAVDVRRGSPNFGCWVATTLSGGNRHQLYIPEGFAHGYCVVSDTALVAYKCTDFYHPGAELTIAWDDPRIGIDWPIGQPALSPKDEAGTRLAHIDPARLPEFPRRTGR